MKKNKKSNLMFVVGILRKYGSISSYAAINKYEINNLSEIISILENKGFVFYTTTDYRSKNIFYRLVEDGDI